MINENICREVTKSTTNNAVGRFVFFPVLLKCETHGLLSDWRERLSPATACEKEIPILYVKYTKLS